jgi:hypothetical protein
MSCHQEELGISPKTVKKYDEHIKGDALLAAARSWHGRLTYDGKPSYTVSMMEFRGDKVARETQYFADPFVAPAWRVQWVERMDT